jgi:NADH-quinone oxidoreductase subunit J
MGGFRVSEEPQVAAVTGQAVAQLSNTRELGKMLYTEYVYPLEIAAAILLVAMIAAIALTLRQRKDSKFVSPSDQVRVKSRDRLTVLSMQATQAALPQTDDSTPTSGSKS